MNELEDFKSNDSSQSKHLLDKPVETRDDLIDGHNLDSGIDNYVDSYSDEEELLFPETEVLFFNVTIFIRNCRFYHEFAFLIYWRFIDLILIDDFSEK